MGNNKTRTWKITKKVKDPVRKLLRALNTYIPPRTQDYSYMKIYEQDIGQCNVLQYWCLIKKEVYIQ